MWIWLDAAAILPCLAVATKYSIWRSEMRLSIVRSEKTGAGWREMAFRLADRHRGPAPACAAPRKSVPLCPDSGQDAPRVFSHSPTSTACHRLPGTPKLGAARGSRARVT
ncbi:hypothetical protein G6F65_023362 [Rhizopus arrhizus]|nr:hypothetical protein G6F65_023362 [Rhizopus arrhizus]